MNLAEQNSSRRGFVRAGSCAAVACAFLPRSSIGSSNPDNALEDGCIDAHVHVWSADTARYPFKPGFPEEKLRAPSFTPEELFRHTRPCGVSRVVLIQMSYYGTDNSYMVDVMREYPKVFSGVAVIDPEEHPRETMKQLGSKGVRGFRIGAGRLGPERWLEGDGMEAMWKCGAEERLSMCPLINPDCLPALDRMCERFPQTPVVIDHFARIGIDGQFRKDDLDNLCGLARHRNVHVKVSAFSALGAKKAPYLDVAPMIRRVLETFGAERLMWATDGPWQMMNGHTYRDSIELIRRGLDFLTDHDRQWLLRKTAERVFFR